MKSKLREIAGDDSVAKDKEEAVYEMGGPQIVKPAPKPRKKRSWAWLWWVVVAALLIAGWLIFKPENLAKISMTSPVDGSSVVGPVNLLSFSSSEKIKTSELTTFSVKSSVDDVDFAGKVSPTKGKVKSFTWTPTNPLNAGAYNVEINGKKVFRANFSFIVTDPVVESTDNTITDTTTTGMTTTEVGDPDFVNSLKESMKSKKEKESGQ